MEELTEEEVAAAEEARRLLAGFLIDGIEVVQLLGPLSPTVVKGSADPAEDGVYVSRAGYWERE